MATKLTYTGAEVQELLDKIEKGDFDNAKTLEGHPASYFAAASEFTSLAESFATEQGRVSTLYSYFNNGSANDALSLGGQLPSYYATATQYEILQQTLTDFKSLFDSMFEKDSEGNIHAKLSLWSSGGITAGGVGSGGSGGGGGISYNRLDSWSDYSADKSGWVLSALLGKDLDNRVSALANAGYITTSALAPYALRSEIPSLVGYATQSWVGDNYLSKSGGVITGQGDTRYVQLRLDGEMSAVMFQQRGIEKGAVGWWSAIGVRLQNTNEYGLAVTDSNYPIFYWGQNGSVQRILLHAGNYADYITNSYLKSTLGISDWALASVKPTYTASEVGALSVNGGDIGGSLNFRNGSSITCANGIVLEMYAGVDTYLRGSSNIYISAPNVYTQRNVYTYKVLDSGNYSSYALSVNGGTVNGSVYMNGYFLLGNSQPIMVADTDGVYQSALYLSVGNNLSIGYGTSVVGKRRTLLFGNTIEFKSNGGEDSTLVLNADRTATFSSTVSAPSFIGNLTGTADKASTQTVLYSNRDVNLWDIGNRTARYFALGDTAQNTPSGAYALGSILMEYSWDTNAGFQMISSNAGNTLLYRSRWNGTFKDWREIACTDSNVASATKLATPRTIWGQPFDGTGNVGGDLYVHQLKIELGNEINSYTYNFNTANGDVHLNYHSSGHVTLANGGGNVAIGGTATEAKLHVYGNGKFTGALTANSLTIGGVTLTYDSVNEALCINGNMYALGGITAGGAGISTYSSLEARVARLEQQLNIS